MSKGTSIRKSKTGGEGARQKAQASDRFASPRSAATLEAIPREEIARRAYVLFLERGGRHGDDVADWLRAEAELTQGRKPGQS